MFTKVCGRRRRAPAVGPFVERGEVRLFFDSYDHDGRARHGEVQESMVDIVFRFFNILMGLGRSCRLGVEFLSHRVVGGYVVSTAFFVRRYASQEKVAYTLKADAHVSESVVVQGCRGPGFVRAVRLVSYCGPSERVRFAFDVLHSRLLDSYTSIGGAGS